MMDMLPSILQTLAVLPYIGPVLVVILKLILPLSLLITALVAMWQGLVKLITALALFPPLSGLQSLAEALKRDDDAVEGFLNGTIYPILNRLSLVPLPTQAPPETPKLVGK